MSELGTSARPLRVAIIGAGPSGFYAAEALIKADIEARVDLVDRLPTPFGLVRGGVAPDHPKIKNVIKVYERLAANEAVRFIGNVKVGRDVSVDDLRSFYDAVIFTCGAETDRRLGIPGEDLPGSHTATEFVGWYNGHPDYRDHTFDLSQEVAVIVGQGNVAMDVSRILAKTVDELRETDIAEHALDALAESRVKEIHLVGRRGPVQAKFTAPEIREMGELAACDPVIDPAVLAIDPISQIELEDATNKHSQKNMAVLREFAAREPLKPKRYHIHFFLSPFELRGADRLRQAVFERNVLEGAPFQQVAKATGEFETIDCGLFFRSVGYRGVPLEGVPYDEQRGVFRNDGAHIISEFGDPLPGLYAAGWIKRGPSGVIGTNKPDSVATVQSLLLDVPNLPPCPQPDSGAFIDLARARGARPVSYSDWQRIDAAEVERGKPKGKPREKFVRIDDMLGVLDPG